MIILLTIWILHSVALMTPGANVLADSIIFATAQKYNATIWIQDNDFQGLPNVKYFSNSKGT